MNTFLKILIVAMGIAPESGGPTRSCKGLCRSLAQAGVDVTLYVLHGHHPFENSCGVKVVYASDTTSISVPLCLCVKNYDLVHLQGLWDPGLHQIARACRGAHVPYIISPRGMLDPWALSVKKWKKRLAMILYQHRDLKHAIAFHVTAEMERDHVRALGFTQPCIVAPNGVDVPLVDEASSPRSNQEQSSTTSHSSLLTSHSRSLRTAIFLSRLHPGKGLIPLAEAWARVRPQGWLMLVVGPDNYGHKAEVIKKLDELGILSQWRFRDQVDDQEKWKLYRSAEILIHPSVSENFGITIAEALYAGLPVICTKGTPWSEVEAHHCGWWIDLPGGEKKIGVENRCTKDDFSSSQSNNQTIQQSNNSPWPALDSALREATSTSTSDLNLLGQRGRALIQEKYTWSAIAQTMVAGYELILKRS